LIGLREDDAVVSYAGRFAPAVAISLASERSGEPATELTSPRSNTTKGDATRRSDSRTTRSLRLREGGQRLHLAAKDLVDFFS
jgi:hypothetical protein